MGARRVWVLTGPTASGKSDVAHLLAAQWGAAVLSADAMLVYRGMDIGTAKPTIAERGSVPYLGVDLVEPWERFDLWRYLDLVHAQLAALPERVPVIVAGGSGLYVRALIEGLHSGLAGASPQRETWSRLLEEQGVAGLQAELTRLAPSALAGLADPENPRRLIRALEQVASGGGMLPRQAGDRCMVRVAGLWLEREVLEARIAQRVARMYDAGLLEEVSALRSCGEGFSETARQAIGYAEAGAYLDGTCSREEAIATTVVRTRRLAKRQRTWFRHQQQTAWISVRAGEPVESVSARVASVWRVYGSVRIA